MNDVDLYELKIDWLKVIDMAFDRKGWGMNYVLYKYGNTVINCIMTTFDFKNKEATFKVTANYTHNGVPYTGGWPDYTSVNYKLDNFSIEEFKAYINRRIVTLISAIKESLILEAAKNEHDELRYWTFQINKEKLPILAKEAGFEKEVKFIDNIDDDKFRETYIDDLKDRIVDVLNVPYHEAVDAFIDSAVWDFGDLQKLSDQVSKRTTTESQKA